MSAPVVVGGRFTLGPAVGSGAAARVYRAVDGATGEEVAVKLALDDWGREEAWVRFEREAAALSVLASPHVVRLIAAGRTDEGTPYLVMELLAGRDLQEEVRRSGSLPPHEVIRWFQEAAQALDLAHGMGIVHRDLKPGNLFLHSASAARTLKVLDFGLVKDVSGELWASADAFVGTPLYMAPEQVRGQATRVGPATDVWALGMVAITLLTAETYWRGPGVAETIADIDAAPLYPPSSRWSWLPPAFDQWFSRSCHRVAEKRFRSVADQAAALAVALRGLVVRETGAATTLMGVASTLIGQRTSDLTAIDPIDVELDGAADRPIGRQVERRDLESRVAIPGAFVTLTGPGGVGKSSLAAAVADALAERRDGGVWWVRLGGVRDGQAVAPAIAATLGLAPDPARPVGDQVAAALVGLSALVVLDGLEQVLAAEPAASVARATLGELRRRAPEVSWLATSRVPTGLLGEVRFAVDPLELPAPGVTVSPAEAASYPAVQLFLRRARDAQPDLAITDANVGDLVAICRQVDGLPLALELAAARLRGLSLAELRRQLGEAGKTSDERVDAAVAWSFGLLGPVERMLLARIAFLPSGASFESALAICRGGATAEEVAGAIQALADASLVQWTPDQPPRLTMLETVRELGRTLGADADAWPSVLAYLERVVAHAEAEMRAGEQGRGLLLLDGEWQNLRAALTRTSSDEPARALALAAGLAWFWYLRGHYQEGLGWLERALAAAPAAEPQVLRRALQGAGELAFLQCRYTQAQELLERSRDLAASLGDPRGVAAAEQMRGSIARERGDYPAARERHEQALATWRALGDQREEARALNYLTFLDWVSAPAGWLDGRARADAEARCAGAEALFAALADREGGVWCRLNRGALAHHGGAHEADAARVHLAAAFADSVGAGYQEGIAWSLNLLGLGSARRGEWVQARAQLRASLKVHRRVGDLWRCASVLEALAAVAVDVGDAARGGELVGAARALRERIGAPVPRCEEERVAITFRRGAGPAFDDGERRGRLLGFDDVVSAATADD